jgi:large subunit ribosomal protein L24e
LEEYQESSWIVLDADSQVKDPFAKPSPGLVKRLAAEARIDSKRRVFQDDNDGPSAEQRREIMEAKARKYEALKRGDFSGMTEKERMESVIDVRLPCTQSPHAGCLLMTW